ncbi:hypothetical protein SAMN04488057_11448 [Cyclobacterium lianum]|uniref:Phage abortive infection protein n=1 Tax=Cyclobacterium lianum TaxID=388280 RepID=A0A1M7Q678_9BACT|nr:hypothetical protein [Cyclobacterium lianum]SHN25666.1 hypothetical protein SAMN04488057_11448 [Cyclobacterium lianum]
MNLDKELQKSIDSLRWKIDTFFVVGIVLAVAALGIYISHLIFPSEINEFFDDEGTDIVNGFTVLLASLSGVLFVYIAFLGQQWQMIYQQQELRENMKEMQELTAQNKIQGNALNEQINKMDRDFVHQNFFRILEQHFNIRDRVKFSYSLEPGTFSKRNTEGRGEDGFEAYFRKVVLWVDDESGWGKKMTEFDKQSFFVENGYPWISKRDDIKNIGNPKNWNFYDIVFANDLTYDEIKFLIRVVITESGFGPYLRSCYYLFSYMYHNSLDEYLDAVEAGMNRFERSFLFYQIATRFEVDNKLILKIWLMEHRFLANIEPKHLLSPGHKGLLYPEGIGPEYKKIHNPHP